MPRPSPRDRRIWWAPTSRSCRPTRPAAPRTATATPRDIVQILKDHGFNAIRTRTFVDPRASDGYDPVDGFGDLAHTIAFGQRVKAAGLEFLLDFHYSDNWADPGKQCVPVAWQGRTLPQLAQALHDYTQDAHHPARGSGRATRHRSARQRDHARHCCCTSATRAARAPATAPSLAAPHNWTNLGTLLKAAAAGVREVDPGIVLALHLDRGGDKATDRPGNALQTSIDWVTNARNQGVAFDVLAESAYQLYQGDPGSDANTTAIPGPRPSPGWRRASPI